MQMQALLPNYMQYAPTVKEMAPPPRRGGCRAAGAAFEDGILHEHEHADKLADRTCKHEYVPDTMHVFAVFTEREEDYAYGICQTAGEQPGKTSQRNAL